MRNAPIILFTYNRPALARQTLRSLQANTLAAQSELFIFSDGPKAAATQSDLENIKEVRRVIKEEQWCSKVTIIEQDTNKGLATSVIEGVTEIVNKYGNVIVVEDDVLLSPYFLSFMNKALVLYENDPRVLSIGSWNYFCEPSKIKEDHFFSRYPDSIAWGTFARAWKLFEHDAAKALTKLKQENKLQVLNYDGEAPYFENMLNMQIEGKVNSWAIRWTATAVLNDTLTVFPKQTLSKHIGFGNDSTHEKSEIDYNSHLVLADRELDVTRPAEIKETPEAMTEWKKFVGTNFTPQQEAGENYANRIKSAVKLRAYRLVHKMIDKVTKKQLTEADSLIETALNFPRYKQTDFVYGNFKFKVSDFLSVAYQLKEYFEDQRLKFNSSNPLPVIIDCGSNVGVSIAYFKSLFPNARITAFEPDVTIFSYLEQNLKNNNFTGVELNNKAVWVHNNGIEFGVEGADGGSIHFEGKKIKVPTKRLKEVLETHKQIDLLKIDIEGAEIDVMLDCGKEIGRVNYLSVEYHSFINSEQKLDVLLNALTENGFRYYIHSIGRQAQQPFKGIDAYNGMDVQLDIYAVNKRMVPMK